MNRGRDRRGVARAVAGGLPTSFARLSIDRDDPGICLCPADIDDQSIAIEARRSADAEEILVDFEFSVEPTAPDFFAVLQSERVQLSLCAQGVDDVIDDDRSGAGTVVVAVPVDVPGRILESPVSLARFDVETIDGLLILESMEKDHAIADNRRRGIAFADLELPEQWKFRFDSLQVERLIGNDAVAGGTKEAGPITRLGRRVCRSGRGCDESRHENESTDASARTKHILYSRAAHEVDPIVGMVASGIHSAATESSKKEEEMSDSQTARIGILTVSDRASQGIYEDLGGPAIKEYLAEVLSSPWDVVYRVVPDERDVVAKHLREMIDFERCCLVVTTGGTGPASRDITPEATEDVCEKLMPGFGELMRKVSLEKVPTAILSRQTAGIRGGGLVINLPGQPKAIRECLGAVMPAVPYCIDLIGGPFITTNEQYVQAFRPKKK